MMETMELLDGSIEIIGSARDFADLIERKLGIEARRWFENFANDQEFDTDSSKDLIASILVQLDDVKKDLENLGGLTWL